jgi:formamidopyrimidine-DNA glycosylase
MPESPEVQAFTEFIGERAVGHTISALKIFDHRVDKTRETSPEVVVAEAVTRVDRRGKYVDLATSGRHIVLSFGRHGWGVWHEPNVPSSPDHAVPVVASIEFSDGSRLDVTDAGDFRSAALWIVADPADVPGIAKLVPDPADPDFAQADVDSVTVRRRKQLKAVLQEQESFAGIGNAYSDEILHTARLSPTGHAATLDEAQRARLFAAMTAEIRGAIAARRGIPIAELKAAKVAAMHVHGRGDQRCPVCGGTIVDTTFAGASAQYCPRCQA